MLPWLLIGWLVLAGWSALIVAAAPRRLSYIQEAARTRPLTACAAGFSLSAFAAGFYLSIILALALAPALGFLLVVIGLLLLIALLGLWLLGAAALALIFGAVILGRRRAAPPLVCAAIGTLALGVFVTVAAIVSPLIAMISVVGIGVLGMGAAFITRCGGRALRSSRLVLG